MTRKITDHVHHINQNNLHRTTFSYRYMNTLADKEEDYAYKDGDSASYVLSDDDDAGNDENGNQDSGNWD